GEVWPWASAEWLADHEKHHGKPLANVAYLNVPFTLGRAFVYFAVWGALAYFLNRWSLVHHATGNAEVAHKCSSLSGPGLVVVALAVTGAAIGWLMSLDPTWYSTIYGMYVGMGEVLSAFSFTVVAVLLLAPRSPLGGVMAEQTQRDLGSLLMAFVMVWA